MHTPGRTHAVVAEFRRLVRGIPALDDLAEAVRALTRFIILEPSGFDHGAAERRRVLLILGREVVLADRLTDMGQGSC